MTKDILSKKFPLLFALTFIISLSSLSSGFSKQSEGQGSPPGMSAADYLTNPYGPLSPKRIRDPEEMFEPPRPVFLPRPSRN